MPVGLQLCSGLLIALVVAYTATPVAVRVATRLEFFDKPAGYKGHAAPTPYLGGAAVVIAFVVTVLLLAGELDRTAPVVVGALVLWGVGTADDKHNLSPYLRLVIEFGIAAAMWALDLGWDLGLGGGVDLFVTCLWIAGVVNAFNLFDNMDGAASAMASVVGGAVAILGAATGDVWVAVAGAALCGACVGFLPHNMASPARIFLGDGGSMPVGFVAASVVMIAASDAAREWQAMAIALLLVGIPLLDTTLVVISRRRRGVPVLTGGRDHLTHRTRRRLRNARAVALALGSAQALLAGLALLAYRGGSIVLVVAVIVYVIAAAVAIEVLDSDFDDETTSELSEPAAHGPRLPPAVLLAGGLGTLAGLSPFVEGAYDSAIWAPAGIVLIALLLTIVIAGPIRLTRPAAVALGGLAALAAWALLSSRWSSSPGSGLVLGNRLLALTALFAVLVVIVRHRRGATAALGGATAGALAVAIWTLWRLIAGSGDELFVAGRLHEPLAYINAQGGVYVLAMLPCLALAELRRRPALSGLAAGCAVLCAGLALLSQSRGVLLAVAAGVAVVVLIAPGRLWRVAALAVTAAGVAAASPWLLDVYQQAPPSESVVRTAGVALAAAAAGAGLAWWAIVRLAVRTGSLGADRARRAWAGALAGVACIGVAAIALSLSSVVGGVKDQYDAFVNVAGDQTAEVGQSRVLSGSGTRYDYWRIAVEEFADHPVAGLGAGGYPVPYLQQRQTTEDVRQPHSLELQVLAELGLVGGLLLVVFLGGIAWGALRTARRFTEADADRQLTVAAAGVLMAWLAQTSGDWLHLLPGVTGVALVAAAVLVRPLSPVSAPRDRPYALSARFGRTVAVVGAVVMIGAMVLLARQALGDHYRSKGTTALRQAQPADALELANRSIRIDPDAIGSYYLRAAAFSQLGDPAEALVTLRDALQREPDNYVTWALMGDRQAADGDGAAALASYRRASALNPMDAELAAQARGE